ncbi:intracellular protein transport protein USO1-like [Xenia sp. Carnegie-2017]|uniref:intracellular protein transport protein USO1-like n=1 Tax=Xenia sp. Carnegie-2017 TaxID=2897299 RepID=UPI001F04BA14|nr:intracellular protein transport protein USO1-like [Xenia sp. Carnegie-2017]
MSRITCGAVLCRIKNIEKQNRELIEAVKTIKEELLKYERDYPDGNRKLLDLIGSPCATKGNTSKHLYDSGKPPVGSLKKLETAQNQLWLCGLEKNELISMLNTSYKREQESRLRLETLRNEFAVSERKLEKNDIGEGLFQHIPSERVAHTYSSREMFLENQLQQQQQLAENYAKDLTLKSRQLSNLTAEKHSLQCEVTSLLSDIESCSLKRKEMANEKVKLQEVVEVCRQKMSNLENELTLLKSGNRQLKSKCKEDKFECASHKGKKLENEKLQLLFENKQLNYDLKIKDMECRRLVKENGKLAEDITFIQQPSFFTKRQLDKSHDRLQNFDYELEKTPCSSLEFDINNFNSVQQIPNSCTTNSLSENKEACKEPVEFSALSDDRQSAEMKTIKRIVNERDEQLKKFELELNELYKKQNIYLTHFLQKDKEIAFLKARVLSSEKNTQEGLAYERSLGQSNFSALQHDFGQPSKETEQGAYLECNVKFKNECEGQHIEQQTVEEFNSINETQCCDLITVDQQENKLQEFSHSKQTIDDSRVKEKELKTNEILWINKTNDNTQLNKDWEQKDEEMKILKRASLDEHELKVLELKDSCRKKDIEIEELSKKIIALQVKTKKFFWQDSHVEDKMGNLNEEYYTDLYEKEKLSSTLSSSELKCFRTKEEVAQLRKTSRDWEQTLEEMKDNHFERDEEVNKVSDVGELMKKNKPKNQELQQKVQKLKEENEIASSENREQKVSQDTVNKTTLEESLKRSIFNVRCGEESVLERLVERLNTLEDENNQLLNRLAELEDELKVTEDNATDLRNVLKGNYDNMNELHAEIDVLKERVDDFGESAVELVYEKDLLQQIN